MTSSPSSQQPRLFLSHSSADKVFVRRLKNDLEAANLNVWLDETEIKVGDSIPQKVSEGLTDADYLVIVLSENSVKSKWVLAELDNALMAQYADRGVVVLPVKIDDCETPPLLKGRVYADFRSDYDKGLLRLLEALEQEAPRSAGLGASGSGAGGCKQSLSGLSDGDLRRRITKKLNRDEVAVLWYDALGDRMADAMGNTGLPLCVVELILRANRKPGGREGLIESLCDDHDGVIHP
jgi:hypothetical protein